MSRDQLSMDFPDQPQLLPIDKTRFETSGMLKFGTCSWKYDSWKGLIYSANADKNYLIEYANYYNLVEVDQWFWSLFPGNQVKLPLAKTVAHYNASVPENFEFGIKMPNSLSLTHFYNRNKSAPLLENPHFFSPDLYLHFLDSLAGLQHKLGPLMLQFEYLNKQKMPSQTVFMQKMSEFVAAIPRPVPLAVEIRNPNYLNDAWFHFLQEHKIVPVLMQGYFMPSIIETCEKFRGYFQEKIIIRLHGPDRQGIEKTTQKRWNQIVAPKDDELQRIAEIVQQLIQDKIQVYFHVNNHYEGSAPLTIEKIRDRINKL